MRVRSNRRKLNQRGAVAFEEALLGVMLTVGCVGGFFAISYSVRGVISKVFGDYNSFGLAFGCSERTCAPEFLPTVPQPLTGDLTPNTVSSGLGQPGGGGGGPITP